MFNNRIIAIFIILLISTMSISPIMATELSNESNLTSSEIQEDSLDSNDVSLENDDVKSSENSDETVEGYFFITLFNTTDKPNEIDSNNSTASHSYGDYIPSGEEQFSWNGSLNKSMIINLIGEENYNNPQWSITNMRMDLINAIISYPEAMIEYLSETGNLDNLFKDNNTQQAMNTIIIKDYLMPYLKNFENATYEFALDDNSPIFYPYVIKKDTDGLIHVDGSIIFDLIFNISYSNNEVTDGEWFEIKNETTNTTRLLDNNTLEVTVTNTLFFQQNHTLNTSEYLINFASINDLRNNISTESLVNSFLTVLDPSYSNTSSSYVIYIPLGDEPSGDNDTNGTGNGTDVPGLNDTNGTGNGTDVPGLNDTNNTGNSDLNESTNSTTNETIDSNGTVIDNSSNLDDSQFKENNENIENETAVMISMPKTGDAIALLLIVLLFALLLMAGLKIRKDKNDN